MLAQGLNCVSQARQPTCEYCVTGDSHQCEFDQEWGITGKPSGFAEYLAIPAILRYSWDDWMGTLDVPPACLYPAWRG